MKTQCPHCNAIQRVPNAYENKSIFCAECGLDFAANRYKRRIKPPRIDHAKNAFERAWSHTPKAFRTGFLATLGVITAVIVALWLLGGYSRIIRPKPQFAVSASSGQSAPLPWGWENCETTEDVLNKARIEADMHCDEFQYVLIRAIQDFLWNQQPSAVVESADLFGTDPIVYPHITPRWNHYDIHILTADNVFEHWPRSAREKVLRKIAAIIDNWNHAYGLDEDYEISITIRQWSPSRSSSFYKVFEVDGSKRTVFTHLPEKL